MSIADTIHELHATGQGDVAQDVARGQRLVGTAVDAVKGIPDLARGVAKTVDTLIAPVGALGRPILRAAGTVGGRISRSPGATRALIAAGLGIPTLGAAMLASSNKNTQEMLNASNNPGATMKLSHFFLKTAAPASVAREAGTSFFSTLPGAVGDGIGKGVGTGLVDTLLSLGSSLGGRVLDSTVTQPQREKTFYEAIRTDSVLRDALRSNPSVLAQMKEAFATLVRFAPSLSLDINAVRSYLREAVISGGGINYATIKQLADTEKTIHDRRTPRK